MRWPAPIWLMGMTMLSFGMLGRIAGLGIAACLGLFMTLRWMRRPRLPPPTAAPA